GFNAKHIVITGGEPCMVDLTPLCSAFELQGYSTQVETSGTFNISVSDKCWVTVSPKINMRGGYPILNSAMVRANEIKHPIATEQHIEELKALLAEHKITTTPVYLQPISQKTRATELAIATCIANNWRLSVQVHKYLGIE
ncbi:MAG: 7-carboxy-7-deazaguanine synthase QueE, partial [Colwellia sp.]|nr:7-carboxy-7-deazaguanine synthase QueE [Colwellia sp.]